MKYLFILETIIGLALLLWSVQANPVGATKGPDEKPGPWITKGPYQFMRHPMYVGEWLLLSGMAGIAAGFLNFCAVGITVELLLRDWVKRETARKR